MQPAAWPQSLQTAHGASGSELGYTSHLTRFRRHCNKGSAQPAARESEGGLTWSHAFVTLRFLCSVPSPSILGPLSTAQPEGAFSLERVIFQGGGCLSILVDGETPPSLGWAQPAAIGCSLFLSPLSSYSQSVWKGWQSGERPRARESLRPPRAYLHLPPNPARLQPALPQPVPLPPLSSTQPPELPHRHPSDGRLLLGPEETASTATNDHPRAGPSARGKRLGPPNRRVSALLYSNGVRVGPGVGGCARWADERTQTGRVAMRSSGAQGGGWQGSCGERHTPSRSERR